MQQHYRTGSSENLIMNNTAQVINLFGQKNAEKAQESSTNEASYVKADVDDGFIRLANKLNEALRLNPAKLSAREFQLFHAIIDRTYR